MSVVSVINTLFDRLVSGLAKLLNSFRDVYVLLRFSLIVAVFFLAGRAISARRVAEAPRAEERRDAIEEFLLRTVGSETAPDVMNLAMISTMFDLVDDLVKLIETADFVDKDIFFPQPTMERLKNLVAEVQMKISELKTRLNVDEEFRNEIKHIIYGSIQEYCINTYCVGTKMVPVEATKSEISPEELKREKTKEEFEKIFEGEEKAEDLEGRLKSIVDLVESYGL